MKQIVNFILAGVVLWLAALWFPAYIQIADFKTLVIATILLFVAEIIVVLAIFVVIAVMVFTMNWAGAVTGIVAVFFAEIIALSLLDLWMPGLVIIGFWPKFLLAVALSIFRIPDTNQNN